MDDFAPVNLNAVGPGVVHNRPDQRTPTADVAAPKPAIDRGADRVEISTTARLLDQLIQGDTVRHDLVAKTREDIAADTYESPEKLDEAINELLGDL